MKLIPCTQFVLEQIENMRQEFKKGHDANFARLNVVDNVGSYASFLSQPLTLSMFVPTSERGEVLENPTGYGCHDPNNPLPDEYMEEYHVFNKALENVLFEGFEFVKRLNDVDGYEHYRFNYKLSLFNINFNKTIEDLIWADLTLTPSAVKQIGL